MLIRRIGAGGMGEVFLAREGGDAPRAVVVKKVLPNLIANRAFVGRFLDEAKVVVRLKHANIARVWAMGEVNGEYFLSMEYVQGKTISRFTKRLRDKKAEMPLGMALLLCERVCQGLQYAHEATDENRAPLHLVHRDLSPANVCISYKGEVKIIDFGAAQSTLKEEQTAPRVVIGNLTYMAPEQAKKQPVDGRADIYSCGVLLWELLAWHALPQKGDPIERWRKAANPSWDPPSALQPNLPREVDEVVLKALRKDPRDRFTNAAEFGEALRKLRQRYASTMTDRHIGELLAKVFAKEKQAEDEVLYEVVYGQTQVDITRTKQVVPPTALAFEHTAILAPAEEIPAVARPKGRDQDITDPGREEAPPPEDGTPTPARDPRMPPLSQQLTRATRASFGLAYSDAAEPRIERSLIEEIEAIGDDELLDDEEETVHPPPPVPTGPKRTGVSSRGSVPAVPVAPAPQAVAMPRPFASAGQRSTIPWPQVALFSGIFVIATSLGFLFVWLALR